MSSSIRPATREDSANLMDLARDTSMFSPNELEGLSGMVEAYFSGDLGTDHHWIVDDDSGLLAAAYFAPEMMGEDVWNLYFIGVRTSARRQGRAEALLRRVENQVRSREGRLLIVETSSLTQFEPVRRLYRKNGFDQEARIRDFYKSGEDKLVFRKQL